MAKEIIKFRLSPGQCRTIAGRRICNRWQSHTSGATEDYKRGIQNPRRPWGKTTCEACDRYKAGVDKAHSRGAYKRGVKRRGSTGWAEKTLLKGPTRFAQGVADAGDAYAKGYKPYHAYLPSIQMGPRFRRGDPRNINRCAAVANAFGQKKISMTGTGKVTCPSK